MPSSFFSNPAASWRRQPQIQQPPNQGPEAARPHEPELASLEDDDHDEAPPASEEPEAAGSNDSDEPQAGTAPLPGADPLRAERRRSNQLEKELRKARAQLARFSEINPDEYARLQDAERKREEFERQVADRERQLNEANLRRVRSVEKERDEVRAQVQNLRKERLMERLFLEAEGRVGGDERGTFFDTFVTLCGGHFQLGEVEGRERLLPVDGKGQPLTVDGVALSDGDYMEELRRHPVYSFLFQQRSGLYSAAVPESSHEHGGAVNLQTLSTAELYLEAVKGTTPRAAAPRR